MVAAVTLPLQGKGGDLAEGHELARQLHRLDLGPGFFAAPRLDVLGDDLLEGLSLGRHDCNTECGADRQQDSHTSHGRFLPHRVTSYATISSWLRMKSRPLDSDGAVQHRPSSA